MGSLISKNKELVGYYSSFNQKDIAVYQVKDNDNWLVYSEDGNFIYNLKYKFDRKKHLFYGTRLFK